MVDDMSANHGRPWGFALDEIKTKVRFWYCELDHSVPPAMGRYLSETVPGSAIAFVPNAGHLWILVNLREVLEGLTVARPGVKKTAGEVGVADSEIIDRSP